MAYMPPRRVNAEVVAEMLEKVLASFNVTIILPDLHAAAAHCEPSCSAARSRTWPRAQVSIGPAVIDRDRGKFTGDRLGERRVHENRHVSSFEGFRGKILEFRIEVFR